MSDSENEDEGNETDAVSTKLSDCEHIDLTNIPSAFPKNTLNGAKMDSIISIVRH